jgi:hypothetical protein
MPRMRLTNGLMLLALALGGCGEETIAVGPPPTPAPTAPRPPAPTPPSDAEVAPTGPTALTYRDEDFVEAETNRDPFRAYTNIFSPTRVREVVQRDVIMRHTPIDEMHLIAIVSGVANPSAMLVDREGTGHTVHRGDYVGSVEVVQTGGAESVPVQLNWRIERIRPDAIVLTRDDPTAPNRPPLTREIALHDPSESGEPTEG